MVTVTRGSRRMFLAFWRWVSVLISTFSSSQSTHMTWVMGWPSGSRVVRAAKFLPLARRRTPSSSTGTSGWRRWWVALRLPGAGGHYPGPEPVGVEQGGALLLQPGEDLGPLGRGHEGQHVAGAGGGDQGLEGGQLARVGGHVGHADRGRALAQQPHQLGGVAAAQVLALLADHDGVGAPGRQLAQGADELV